MDFDAKLLEIDSAFQSDFNKTLVSIIDGVFSFKDFSSMKALSVDQVIIYELGTMLYTMSNLFQHMQRFVLDFLIPK